MPLLDAQDNASYPTPARITEITNIAKHKIRTLAREG